MDLETDIKVETTAVDTRVVIVAPAMAGVAVVAAAVVIVVVTTATVEAAAVVARTAVMAEDVVRVSNTLLLSIFLVCGFCLKLTSV